MKEELELELELPPASSQATLFKSRRPRSLEPVETLCISAARRTGAKSLLLPSLPSVAVVQNERDYDDGDSHSLMAHFSSSLCSMTRSAVVKRRYWQEAQVLTRHPLTGKRDNGGQAWVKIEEEQQQPRLTRPPGGNGVRSLKPQAFMLKSRRVCHSQALAACPFSLPSTPLSSSSTSSPFLLPSNQPTLCSRTLARSSLRSIVLP